MKCQKCNKEHDGSFGSGRFCSRGCANSRIKSEETKAKISKSVRKWVEENPDKITSLTGENHPNFKHGRSSSKEEKICKTCGKIFRVSIYSQSNYCSGKCNPLHGGQRIGSGRGNSGWYKGIRCDSTYELVWVIYRLDHDLPVKRFEGCLKEGELIYYPDFIEDNTIIELKGYFVDKVNQKCELARNRGYDINVLYEEDLKNEFAWVKKNYEYKYLRELYDDFKPTFVYICSWCGKEFHTVRRRKTEIVCCSRECSMKNAQKTYDYSKHSEIMKKYYENAVK